LRRRLPSFLGALGEVSLDVHGLQRFTALLLAAMALVTASAGPAEAGRRRFFDTVNAGSGAFIDPNEYRAYVDTVYAHGIRGLRIAGQWRMKCWQCAPDTLDFDTEPAPGVFDFSVYFDRLDYAIVTKGMKAMVSFNLGGKLPTDALVGGAQPVLPGFLNADDTMMYRASAGVDVPFQFNSIRTPRIDRPSTRQAMLDFVTAVVTQFRARYGDEILDYSFTIAHFGESEYPLAPPPGFCDTSPDAAAAFRLWLQAHYGTPQAVAVAWGHVPPFTSFSQVQILDGQASPPLGQAPPTYLDFMAYRESSLGAFLHDVRDAVHAAGGRVMAQFGSVWDQAAATRGTFGFGKMVQGFDLVVIDDAPTYDHLFSMDYTRTNSGGVPFGNEVDAPCNLGCTTGNVGQCCYPFPNPSWNQALGQAQMNAQVAQSYDRGATWVDLANWDNFFPAAFGLYSTQIATAVNLAAGLVTNPVPAATQHVSLKQLYVHHHDGNYIAGLIQAHTALGGQTVPIAVQVDSDLEPPVATGALSDPIELGISLSVSANPARDVAWIRFSLARQEHVRLRVFDAAGRAVVTLAARDFEPGRHAVPFDGGHLPRGVYLVRLETSRGSASNKLEIAR
jgi:hypothetical protein